MSKSITEVELCEDAIREGLIAFLIGVRQSWNPELRGMNDRLVHQLKNDAEVQRKLERRNAELVVTVAKARFDYTELLARYQAIVPVCNLPKNYGLESEAAPSSRLGDLTGLDRMKIEAKAAESSRGEVLGLGSILETEAKPYRSDQIFDPQFEPKPEIIGDTNRWWARQGFAAWHIYYGQATEKPVSMAADREAVKKIIKALNAPKGRALAAKVVNAIVLAVERVENEFGVRWVIAIDRFYEVVGKVMPGVSCQQDLERIASEEKEPVQPERPPSIHVDITEEIIIALRAGKWYGIPSSYGVHVNLVGIGLEKEPVPEWAIGLLRGLKWKESEGHISGCICRKCCEMRVYIRQAEAAMKENPK